MPGPYNFPTTINVGDPGHVAWGMNIGAAINEADPAATPNVMIERDSFGRAKVATPSAVDDIATKGYVDTGLGAKANSASPAFTGTPTGITKAHVGLGNVDNTSDANKPVSIAQAAADALAIPKSLVTAKGDLLAASGSGALARVGVGSNGQVLTVDSAQAAGVKWAAASGGGGFVGGKPKPGEWVYNASKRGSPHGAITMTAGVLYCVPLYNLGPAFSIDVVNVRVETAGAAGAVIRLGLYALDSSGFDIGALIADFGTVAATTNGPRQIVVSQVIPTGISVLVAVSNDSTIKPGWIGSGPIPNPLFWRGNSNEWPGPDAPAFTYSGYSTAGLPSTATTSGFALLGEPLFITVRVA